MTVIYIFDTESYDDTSATETEREIGDRKADFILVHLLTHLLLFVINALSLFLPLLLLCSVCRTLAPSLGVWWDFSKTHPLLAALVIFGDDLLQMLRW